MTGVEFVRVLNIFLASVSCIAMMIVTRLTMKLEGMEWYMRVARWGQTLVYLTIIVGTIGVLHANGIAGFWIYMGMAAYTASAIGFSFWAYHLLRKRRSMINLNRSATPASAEVTDAYFDTRTSLRDHGLFKRASKGIL